MNYLREWGQSGVIEELTQLNVIALDSYRPLEYLLYADGLPRRNDGRLSDRILQRYDHLLAGGWWCSGVDLLTGKEDTWGCFKPIEPRFTSDQRKVIKYEHPPQVPTGIFALRVSLSVWEKIAQRHGLSILPTEIQADQPDLGFWEWVINHPQVSLCITEGAKKAGALLSLGYAAIALPGIYGGYRTGKDEWGRYKRQPQLIPQLQKLATPERQIYLVFDQDIKPVTVRAVQTAIRQMGYLFQQAQCLVKVITWRPELGKGIDDFIASQGELAFTEIYENAESLEVWKAQFFHRLTFPPQVEINQRYIGDYLTTSSLPKNLPLIAIKSPKGTGKTLYLEQLVKQALTQGKKVLVIGHRVRLVESLCQRFGLPYVTELADHQSVQGYGLCIDSLHPQSQASFHPQEWSNSLIIIDEVEQVLWHGLNSSTCSHQRVSILKSLKTLMQTVLGGEGQVILADADLSDISLEYLIALGGVDLEPYVILNHWKPGINDSWNVYNYTETTPNQWVKDLEKHIREGGKPLVCLSAQKAQSKWGTRTLETYLKQQFPQAKILRIDSESLTDPSHPAQGCIQEIDQVFSHYDIVLASPSIETGISINLVGHFTSVWGIAQGIQGENSVRQILGRLRENVPRFLWVAKQGFNQVGNGATSLPGLLSSGEKLTQVNIRLLQQADFDGLDNFQIKFQAESLLCWAKMAVRLNSTMLRYRQSVLAALEAEGHHIIPILPPPKKSPKKSKKVKKSEELLDEIESDGQNLTEIIAAVRDKNYQAECQAIAFSPELTDGEYQILERQLLKTTSQRRSQRKYELKRRYFIPITPELVAQDDGGWYQQIRLHYFLTVGRPYLSLRDTTLARNLIEQGEGNIFLPDFNRSQLGVMIGTMELLGISVLLQQPQRLLKNSDEDLLAMSKLALRNRVAIKTIMGIGLAQNSSPITIIKRFLDKIGYQLEWVGTQSHQKKRLRVYKIGQPKDERFTIFEQWLSLESQFPNPWGDNFLDGKNQTTVSPVHRESDYIQLSLDFWQKSGNRE